MRLTYSNADARTFEVDSAESMETTSSAEGPSDSLRLGVVRGHGKLDGMAYILIGGRWAPLTGNELAKLAEELLDFRALMQDEGRLKK